MSSNPTFSDLGLPPHLLTNLNQSGYETPMPVQSQVIPLMLEGQDVLAQAQTGTGKTAAFALPIISRLDNNIQGVQCVILTPTRELANQVTDHFNAFMSRIDLKVLAIYGGQDYRRQIKGLKDNPQIIVATPGRLMDHMDSGRIRLDHLKTLVLDEADEMLNMGFLSDVEWILSRISCPHQTALFSATMPPAIKQVAANYLNQPQYVKIKAKQATVPAIEQVYTLVNHHHKLELLVRTLEGEAIDAAIIFAQRKKDTETIAHHLSQFYPGAVEALNGDMNQAAREKAVHRLRRGHINIIIATDVASRGLDVERITHVINYDIPNDAESYIHRVGRTGRAGRTGKAILFVTPRELRELRNIERTLGQSIEAVEPLSPKAVQARQYESLAAELTKQANGSGSQANNQATLDELMDRTGLSEREIALALLKQTQGAKPQMVDPSVKLPSLSDMKQNKAKQVQGKGKYRKSKFQDGPKFSKKSKAKRQQAK